MPKSQDKKGDKVVRPVESWTHVLELYFKRQTKKNHSPLTIEKYDQVLRDFFLFNGEEVTRNGIRTYLTNLQLQDKHLKITINKHLIILRTFFNWATKYQHIDFNPMIGIELLKSGKKTRTVLYKDQIEKLYTEAEKDPLVLGQDLVMFDVFYGTGIRTNELCHIDIEDVDREKRTLKIRVAKGGDERIVAVPARVFKHLLEYLTAIKIRFPTSSVLFPNRRGKRINPRYVYERIQRVLSRMLSQKKGAHTLRHSFATVMIDEGAPISAVQKQLGHKTAATTQLYDHTAIDRLKKVHEAAHPKNNMNN